MGFTVDGGFCGSGTRDEGEVCLRRKWEPNLGKPFFVILRVLGSDDDEDPD